VFETVAAPIFRVSEAHLIVFLLCLRIDITHCLRCNKHVLRKLLAFSPKITEYSAFEHCDDLGQFRNTGSRQTLMKRGHESRTRGNMSGRASAKSSKAASPDRPAAVNNSSVAENEAIHREFFVGYLCTFGTRGLPAFRRLRNNRVDVTHVVLPDRCHFSTGKSVVQGPAWCIFSFVACDSKLGSYKNEQRADMLQLRRPFMKCQQGLDSICLSKLAKQ
jgi:hypothetical protein